VRVFLEQYNPKSDFNLCYAKVEDLKDLMVSSELLYVDVKKKQMTQQNDAWFVGKNLEPISFTLPDEGLMGWFLYEASYGVDFENENKMLLAVPWYPPIDNIDTLVGYLNIITDKEWSLSSEDSTVKDTDTGVIYDKTKKQLDFVITEDGQCLERVLSCETYDVAKTRDGYICVSKEEGGKFVSEAFLTLELHMKFVNKNEPQSSEPDQTEKI
jgi:hypothetical protein